MSNEELPIGWIIRTNKLTSNKVSETLKSVLHFSKFNFTLNNKVDLFYTVFFEIKLQSFIWHQWNVCFGLVANSYSRRNGDEKARPV